MRPTNGGRATSAGGRVFLREIQRMRHEVAPLSLLAQAALVVAEGRREVGKALGLGDGHGVRRGVKIGVLHLHKVPAPVESVCQAYVW